MASPIFDAPNPYQSPASAGLPPQAPISATNLALVKLVKRFRTESHSLGAAWIIIGSLAIGLGLLATPAAIDGRESRVFTLLMVFAFGVSWFLAGVNTCLKQPWAMYMGLAATYLWVALSVFNLNFCIAGLLIVVIVQGHRVISWTGELKRAGIQLTTRPEQLQVEFRPPAGLT